ncbi:MAG: UrcA family protein [Phenylobacterium sp.]
MRLLPVLFATVIALAAAPALAADLDGAPITRQATVKLGDLDLATPTGARAAIRRLTRAAYTVCGDGESMELIRHSTAFQRCRAATLETAVRRIDRPAVTASFAQTRGGILRLAGR